MSVWVDDISTTEQETLEGLSTAAMTDAIAAAPMPTPTPYFSNIATTSGFIASPYASTDVRWFSSPRFAASFSTGASASPRRGTVGDDAGEVLEGLVGREIGEAHDRVLDAGLLTQ